MATWDEVGARMGNQGQATGPAAPAFQRQIGPDGRPIYGGGQGAGAAARAAGDPRAMAAYAQQNATKARQQGVQAAGGPYGGAGNYMGGGGGMQSGSSSPQMLASALRGSMGGGPASIGGGIGAESRGAPSSGGMTQVSSSDDWSGMNREMYAPTPAAQSEMGWGGAMLDGMGSMSKPGQVGGQQGGQMFPGGSSTFNENSGGFRGGDPNSWTMPPGSLGGQVNDSITNRYDPTNDGIYRPQITPADPSQLRDLMSQLNGGNRTMPDLVGRAQSGQNPLASLFASLGQQGGAAPVGGGTWGGPTGQQTQQAGSPTGGRPMGRPAQQQWRGFGM